MVYSFSSHLWNFAKFSSSLAFVARIRGHVAPWRDLKDRIPSIFPTLAEL